MSPPSLIKRYPWATFGRREGSDEFHTKWQELREREPLLSYRPKVSLLICVTKAVYERHFLECLESIRQQSYSNWEAIIALVPSLVAWSEKISQLQDKRFRVLVREANEAELKNRAIEVSQGEWIGVCDPEGLLSPVCLSLCVRQLEQDRETRMLFSNELELGKRGTNIKGYLSKAQLSWFSLLHGETVGRFCLIEKSTVEALGPYDAEFPILHERDFSLRFAEQGFRCSHLPAFLYYRRQHRSPTEVETVKLAEAAIKRRGLIASVSLGPNGQVAVRPHVENPGLCSAIICFRDKAEFTIRCLKGLVRSAAGIPLEIFLVNNGSTQVSLAQIKSVAKEFNVPVTFLNFDGPFNFAAMHNWVIKEHARGELVLFLNNDVFLKKGELADLVAWARFSWVGTVGMCLRFPHGAIQHAGIRAGFGGSARLARLAHVQEEDAIYDRSRCVFANTFAACLIRRDLYLSLGGLDAVDLANGFGDIALNFECLRRGLENLYLAHVEGVHVESASRGTSYEYWEEVWLEKRYPEILQRMLREDLGYGRVPGSENSVGSLLGHAKEALLVLSRQKMPWLKPARVQAKKWVKQARGALGRIYEPLH